MRHKVISNRLSCSALVVAFGILSLSSCQNQNQKPTFSSEQQYRHALYRGGYETIKFKPDGSVFVKMLVNGVDVIANGKYERDKLITIKLPTNPKRNLVFMETPDKKLLSFETNHHWQKF